MSPFYAFKETRVDLDPSVPGSTISIRLPAYGSSARASKTALNRSQVTELPIAEDEASFRKRHLASASSIYHRTYHKSPRSFLWRVLEDGKVLSIRTVDVCKQAPDAPEAHLTLRLSFPNEIKPHCVAFSDSEQHDVLTAFVLTESKHLYTLTLRPDYFRRASSTEDNVNEWCKSYLSSAFAFKAAHRLVALSADEVLLSFIDGGLVRLSKPSGGDGSHWTERYYSEGGWSLRGIFQANNTIRYGKANLELSTATSIASPVTSIDGMPYVFTVCLDHRLRVWNLQTGKVAFMGDILDQDLEPQEHAKQVIQPSYSQLIRVYENNEENALCVTFSPLGTGQFKFWIARPAPDGLLDVVDMFPNNHLEPLVPSSELWTLADFSVAIDRSGSQTFKLWTLWKNNISYRVQMIEFQNDSIAKVKDAWKNGWKSMVQETLLDAALPVLLSGNPSDATDQWLDFILAPGRFSNATIETGLAIYERGSGTAADGSKTSSLPERLSSSIASTSSLSRAANGTLDHEQFRSATDIQWRRFYRLLLELHAQRGEALSLVLDPLGELPEVVLADGIAVVREGSKLERIWHNANKVPSGAEHVARPLFAASGFRDSVSDQFLHSCKTALLGEIYEEPSLAGPARMRAFYDRCDFSNQIGDEEYNQLVASLGGGFTSLTETVYEHILSLLDGSQSSTQKQNSAPFADYGGKVILRGVQEIVELHRNIALDQLIVLVLVEAEINHGDEGLGIESSLFFLQLLDHLQRLELINWLTSTQIVLPLQRTERSSSITEKSGTLNKKVVPSTETVSVLEGVFRHLFGANLRARETLSSAITEVIVQICNPNSREYETAPSSILGWLLFHERVDLALEFVRFGGRDPFSTYMQGRVFLASNDPSAAASHFKKAAFGMSRSDPKGHYSSSGFLGNTARESFNQGLAKYYAHVVALYDKEKLFSYVIDFARLALQFLRQDTNPNTHQSRTEMHSRLFNAAIQTSCWELAHSTLHIFTDRALQTSSLRTLVTRLSESKNASKLVSLPFLTLQDQVDEILAQKCSSIMDVNAGVAYHKILYAWRISHNDFRGAAAVALDRLQRLQLSGEGDRFLDGDGSASSETPVTMAYVQLINALACVDPEQAWVLAEEVKRGKNGTAKRRVVTLNDVRRAYQNELDRVSAMGKGQFSVVANDLDGDEMDIL